MVPVQYPTVVTRQTCDFARTGFIGSRIRDDGPVTAVSATVAGVFRPAYKTARNFPMTCPSPTPSSNSERASSRARCRGPLSNLPTTCRWRQHLRTGRNSSRRSIRNSTSSTRRLLDRRTMPIPESNPPVAEHHSPIVVNYARGTPAFAHATTRVDRTFADGAERELHVVRGEVPVRPERASRSRKWATTDPASSERKA